MAKTRKGFENSLFAISVFGFTVILLNSGFLQIFALPIIDLTAWQTAFFLVAAGLGLLAEGEIRNFKELAKGGIQGREVPIVLTLLVGLISIIVGVLSSPVFPNLATQQLNTVTGIISAFAILFLVLQKYYLD